MPRLWLPPKVWCQLIQSTNTGGSSSICARVWRSICWLLHSILWVVGTTFGSEVEPEVNMNLAMSSARICAWRCSTASVAGVFKKSSNFRQAWPSISPLVVIIG